MAEGTASALLIIVVAAAIFADVDDDDDDDADEVLPELPLELHPAAALPVRAANASTPITRVAVVLVGLRSMPFLL
jgi:hypothetical protein